MQPRRADRGSMLVLVLFLAGLLSVFAAVAAMAMRAAQNSSRGFAENLRAEEAARGAIEQIIATNAGSITNLKGTSLLTFGDMQVVVTARNESARIDLNQARPELLTGLFRQLGVAPEQADIYTARIVDWRDEDDKVTKGGAERAAYRAVGRVDGPRNGPFVHTAELGLVLGVPAAVAAAAAPYVTVASHQEQINPLLADPTVLLALPGATPDKVRDFLSRRANPTATFELLTSALGPVQDYITQEAGLGVRVEAQVKLTPNNERRFEAVVYALAGDTEPYRILAWDPNPPDRIRPLP